MRCCSARSARPNTIAAREPAPEAGLLLLRRALGGYANLRPAISYAAIADCSRRCAARVFDGADILFVRELLGGLYFGEPRGISDANRNDRRHEHDELFGRRDRAGRTRRF
jgi:3-isopropylmalate dehydrogenase